MDVASATPLPCRGVAYLWAQATREVAEEDEKAEEEEEKEEVLPKKKSS
jgi:hypothetical protein